MLACNQNNMLSLSAAAEAQTHTHPMTQLDVSAWQSRILICCIVHSVEQFIISQYVWVSNSDEHAADPCCTVGHRMDHLINGLPIHLFI